VNPSPGTVMQTTIFFRASKGNFDDFGNFVNQMHTYAKGYTPQIKPTYISDDTLMVSIKMYGSEDYLSKYAGNLDIINCAAIEVAKKLSTLKGNETKPKNAYNDILDI